MEASVAELPIEDFDYDQLAEATVSTGHFTPTTDEVWFLTGQGDEAAALRFVTVSPLPFRVGRRSDLSLCLPFQTVSSMHAEIFSQDGKVFVRDHGSTNGTFVNGSRIDREVELREGDLIQFANVAFRLVRQVTGTYRQTDVADACDQALALTRFDELLTERAVVPHFQPIVDLADEAVIGYEVLGRSRLFGLRSPKEMFMAAAQLNLETELSRMLRIEGIEKGMLLPNQAHLFVNTHPCESNEPRKLYESLEEIRQLTPDQPITLEVHESAAVMPDTMSELRSVLNALDMKLAYDDFGAGQARLVELVKVTPDYLKFDMSLIQNIHQASAQHQQMLSALVQMTRRLGIVALAEGVECKEDSETCREMGFELGQGYHYSRPAPASAFQVVEQ